MTDFKSYEAAHSTAAFYVQPKAGTIRLQGPDRLAFLQRQSTNDLNRLAPGRSLVTVLTSPLARTLDVLRLWEEHEGLIGITLPGQSGSTVRFLKSRIFFMDKVSVTDLSVDYAQIDLEGPQATQYLIGLGLERAPGMDEVLFEKRNGETLRVAGQPGFGGAGYRLIVPVQVASAVESALDEMNLASLSDDTYQLLRVEAGLPAPRAELTEDYTPLETGLEWAVAEGKGCYTGQEVIARQMTYDKVTQHLVGLRLSNHTQPGERVWAEGKPAGVVTSAVYSPRFGEIALAIIRRPHHQAGSLVQVGNSQAQSVAATVSSLPFSI
jgi:folate-binding protein YgfZ